MVSDDEKEKLVQVYSKMIDVLLTQYKHQVNTIFVIDNMNNTYDIIDIVFYIQIQLAHDSLRISKTRNLCQDI